MHKIHSWLISLCILCAISSAHAELGDTLKIPKNQRQSTYILMGRDNQHLQDDMTLNPALFSMMEGDGLWNRSSEKTSQSCASCHGEPENMSGVAATFPKLINKKLSTLEDQINLCRSKQNLPAYAHESRELLSLASLVAFQSRGHRIKITLNKEMKSYAEQGERLFNQRIGQINLSCANCHEERAGISLGGVMIPQGHPTGYPIYRLEWQSMGSLGRRLRNCMIGVRAEPYTYDSLEIKQLELFLKIRAQDMVVESPAVRP